MQTIEPIVIPANPMQDAFVQLSKALEQSTAIQIAQAKAAGKQSQCSELTTAVTWVFYGIEDRDHDHYLNPELFLQE